MPKKKKNSPFLFFFVGFLGCCAAESTVVTITGGSGSQLAIRVEVADSPEERARGLMHRSLSDGEGMLFLFSEETQGSFWMKDTPIPLDLIFIRKGLIIDIIENAVPFDEALLTPDGSYDMTLEVSGGTVSRNSIQVGDQVSYR